MEGRKGGVDGVVQTMQDEVRELCEASGKVSDDRRLVAFLYLLIRDEIPAGALAQAVRDTVSLDLTKRAALRQGHTAIASKLTDANTERVEDCLAWLFKMYTVTPRAVSLLVDRMPPADDVTTVFTNGWLARYAQYVTDQLTASDGATT